MTLFLAIIIATPFLKAENISIPGFGEIPVKKTGNKFKVNLKKYGTFDFSGSIEPLSLETSAKIEQLVNMPGYNVMSKMGLKQIKLKITPNGFEIYANAETKGNLKRLCKLLKIKAPYIGIGIKVAKNGFAIRGDLMFSKQPIVLNLVKKLGTRISLDAISISMDVGIEYGPGENEAGKIPGEKKTNKKLKRNKPKKKKFNKKKFTPVISLVTNMRIRPTKSDPDLRTVTELSYNLVTQEITLAASMVDRWANPLGMSKFVKTKDFVVLENAAVQIGWIPGSPTPTNIGFYIEKAKIADIETGVGMSIAPASAEIAFKANINRISPDDLANILRKGFGTKVPDVFPKDFYIKDGLILFSPNGGKIGEFEIEKGFALGGKMKLGNLMDAQLDFFTDLENEIRLGFRVDANFKREIMKKVKNISILKPIMGTIFETFEIRKLELLLSAKMSGQLKGKAAAELTVLSKDIKFDIEGEFDASKIIDKTVNKIKKIGGDVAGKVTKEVTKYAKIAGKEGKKVADKAWKTGVEVARQAGIAVSHFYHTKSHCMNTCVPNHARSLAESMLRGSKQAIDEFYRKSIKSLKKINGLTKYKTKKLRKDYINNSWKELIRKLDSQWENVRKDRDYVRYFTMPKSAAEGGRKYRRLVDERKAQYKKYKNRIWNKMMTEVAPLELYKYVWTKKMSNIVGTTQLIPVETKYKSYVLTVNSNKGKIDVYNVNSNGSISQKTSTKNIQKGTWAVTAFEKNNKNFIFVSHSNSGKVEVYSFKNGKIVSKVWSKGGFPKGIRNVVAIKDGVFLYKPKDGKALFYKTESNGSLGKKIWEKSWDKGNLSLVAVSDKHIFYVRANGVAGVYIYRNSQFKPVWLTNKYNKGITVTAANYYTNNNSTIHIADPSKGKQWILNYDGIKRVDVAYFKMWPKNISVQALVNRGKHISLIDPQTGQIWSNAVFKGKSNGKKNDGGGLKGVYKIKSPYSSKYWDLPGNASQGNRDGANLQLWSIDNGADRKVKFIPAGGGFYYIQFQNGGRVVDVSGNNHKRGTNVHAWTKNGSDAQKFKLIPVSGMKNVYSIIHKGSGKALDAAGGNLNKNGVNIHTWDYSRYNKAQHWQLVPTR